MRRNRAKPLTDQKALLGISSLAPVLELGKEPGTGVSPMALGGCQRDLHHPGDLGLGQTDEEAELDQFCLRRVFRRQLGEGQVEGFEVFGCFLLQEPRTALPSCPWPLSDDTMTSLC